MLAELQMRRLGQVFEEANLLVVRHSVALLPELEFLSHSTLQHAYPPALLSPPSPHGNQVPSLCKVTLRKQILQRLVTGYHSPVFSCDPLGSRRRGSLSPRSQQGPFVVGICMFGQMSSQERAEKKR